MPHRSDMDPPPNWFHPLSDDHSEGHPATLSYEKPAGLRPRFSRCVERRPNGSHMWVVTMEAGFSVSDLEKIVDYMKAHGISHT